MEINNEIKQYFAEFDTDKIIRETYFPDFNYKGVMIEVGGGTPQQISTSKHFKLNGWRAIIFEPNPKYVNMHKDADNEVYEYALSNEDKDDVTFQVVDWGNTNLSFSSIRVKDGYLKKHNYNINQLPITEIKVKVRKLNTILKEINLTKVDFISIDTEGWELEVLEGFDIKLYNPKVVLLENYLYDEHYIKYMDNVGYKLDKTIDYNYIFINK